MHTCEVQNCTPKGQGKWASLKANIKWLERYEADGICKIKDKIVFDLPLGMEAVLRSQLVAIERGRESRKSFAHQSMLSQICSQLESRISRFE